MCSLCCQHECSIKFSIIRTLFRNRHASRSHIAFCFSVYISTTHISDLEIRWKIFQTIFSSPTNVVLNISSCMCALIILTGNIFMALQRAKESFYVANDDDDDDDCSIGLFPCSSAGFYAF